MQRARLTSGSSVRNAAPLSDPAGPTARHSRTLAAGLAAAGLLLAGCDSAVGIPGDEPAATAAQASTSASSTAPAPQPIAPGEPHPGAPSTTRPPVPADAPAIGAVPGVPAAAPAVARWAADLKKGSITQLQAACWELPPLTVADMYADPQPVLTALARPGTADEDTVTWRNGSTVVTVDRAFVAAGYACGRVSTTGAPATITEADARHAVRRYLARATGAPLDPADTEAAHPLTCRGATWDPEATGRPTQAPLLTNPGKAGTITAFTAGELSSTALGSGYVSVTVPVTVSGVTRSETFVLAETPEGYCLGDVSS
ncbi:hypothetical protein [Nocardia thailandica]|uniref:Lipoprotein n=1 Tax=Nocardia thailandica TaxID=257275 RepID=A0ABW6PGL2_9NOCA